jgi:hypothetical protein
VGTERVVAGIDTKNGRIAVEVEGSSGIDSDDAIPAT